MNKINQCQKIINYIEQNGSITARDALGLGCMRLASRISDIKKRWGVDIATEMIPVKNADGTKTRIAKYTIVQ